MPIPSTPSKPPVWFGHGLGSRVIETRLARVSGALKQAFLKFTLPSGDGAHPSFWGHAALLQVPGKCLLILHPGLSLPPNHARRRGGWLKEKEMDEYLVISSLTALSFLGTEGSQV
jgi:hypothetical protein